MIWTPDSGAIDLLGSNLIGRRANYNSIIIEWRIFQIERFNEVIFAYAKLHQVRSGWTSSIRMPVSWRFRESTADHVTACELWWMTFIERQIKRHWRYVSKRECSVFLVRKFNYLDLLEFPPQWWAERVGLVGCVRRAKFPKRNQLSLLIEQTE